MTSKCRGCSTYHQLAERITPTTQHATRSNRRSFLKRVTGGALAVTLAPPLLNSSLFVTEARAAAHPPAGMDGRYFIELYLAGGFDGLHVARPTSLLSQLGMLRPNINNPANDAGAANLVSIPNSPFAIHPRFAAPIGAQQLSVARLLQLGQGAIISKVASPPNPDMFSHSAAQSIWDRGAEAAASGVILPWMARLMHHYDMAATQVFRLNASFFPSVPGREKPIAVANLASFRMVTAGDQLGGVSEGAAAAAAAEAMVRAAQSQVQQGTLATTAQERAVLDGLEGMFDTLPVMGQYINQPLSQSFPGDGAGATLADAARVILRSEARRQNGEVVGPTFIQIVSGGFDHHEALLRWFNPSLDSLNQGIAALAAQLGPVWNRTVVSIVSEFGRVNFENSASGTDHGRGNILFLLGGAYRSSRGPLIGAEVTSADLLEPYLPMGLDFRSVYAELIEWMGLDAAIAFPSFPRGSRLNLFTSVS